MITRLICCTLLLFISFQSSADGRKGTYIWPAYNQISVPDSLKNESAFFISNVTTIDFMESFETEVIIFKRVYINSEEAAEKYSKKDIFIGHSGYISMLAARTIKKDGRTIELNNRQIIETSSEKKNKYGTETTVRRIQLIYPEVEIGDVVDLAYQIDIDHYIYSDLMYLEDEIPSLYSRITLRNLSMLDITSYSLNNMPKRISKTNAGMKTISWEKRGVSSIKTDYFNALAADAPCLVFVLWKRGEPLGYEAIYGFDVQDYPKNYDLLSSIQDHLIENGVFSSDDNQFVQLKKMIHYFENEFSWNTKDGIHKRETTKFLYNKKVDRKLFLRYVMKFLRENRIEYMRGFSKSLLNGKFDHGVVSLEQLSQRFLLINDEEGQLHFLFPPRGEGQFYYLDEIPFYLEGNESVALAGERGLLKERSMVALPESSAKNNRQISNMLIDVKVADSIICTLKRKDIFSGHYSFLTRDENSSIWLEELNIADDSVDLKPSSTKEFYPYDVEYNQENVPINILERLDDSLAWLNTSDLLPLGIYQGDELNADYGNHLILPFLKQTEILIYLKSNTPIALAENESELSFKNAIGSIKVNIYQMDELVLKINYSIAINQRYIVGEEAILEFKELIQKYSEIVSKKWVLKV